MNHAARIAALRARMAEEDLPVLVVSRAANVRYLTGYVGSNGVAVVGPDDAVLVTDSRYAVSARAQVSAARVEIARQDLIAGISAEARALGGGGPVGVEADVVTLAWHERLVTTLDGPGTRATTGLVDTLRLRKDADEIAQIRRAAKVADAALQRVVGAGLVGRAETEVALALLGAVVDLGAEGLSFPAIVAAAERGARPHAVPTRERIGTDTLTVIDMGALLESGYMSDMTRTVATGSPPEAMTRIYGVCLEAQRAAVAAVRPGVTAGEVDAVARGIIAEAGHAEHFGHGLGHGVGLELHEGPGLRTGSDLVLAPGMVVTVEPGIYIEGLAGVRIEDLVLITEDGHEVLSTTPTELWTVA